MFLAKHSCEYQYRRNLSLLAKGAPTLTQVGITFRDLNKNCKLDPYEDPRHPFHTIRCLEISAQMMTRYWMSSSENLSRMEDYPLSCPHPWTQCANKRKMCHAIPRIPSSRLGTDCAISHFCRCKSSSSNFIQQRILPMSTDA